MKRKLLVFVLIIFGFGLVGNLSACKYGKGDAEVNAWNYLDSMNLRKDAQAVNCISKDSDNNGYVSCSVAFSAESNRSPMALECATGHGNFGSCNPHEGCRLITSRQ